MLIFRLELLVETPKGVESRGPFAGTAYAGTRCQTLENALWRYKDHLRPIGKEPNDEGFNLNCGQHWCCVSNCYQFELWMPKFGVAHLLEVGFKIGVYSVDLQHATILRDNTVFNLKEAQRLGDADWHDVYDYLTAEYFSEQPVFKNGVPEWLNQLNQKSIA